MIYIGFFKANWQRDPEENGWNPVTFEQEQTCSSARKKKTQTLRNTLILDHYVEGY